MSVLLPGSIASILANFSVGGIVSTVSSHCDVVPVSNCMVALFSKFSPIALVESPFYTTSHSSLSIYLILLSRRAVPRIILSASLGAAPKTAVVTCLPSSTWSLATLSILSVLLLAALMLAWIGCTNFSQSVDIASSRVKLEPAFVSSNAVTIVGLSWPLGSSSQLLCSI